MPSQLILKTNGEKGYMLIVDSQIQIVKRYQFLSNKIM